MTKRTNRKQEVRIVLCAQERKQAEPREQLGNTIQAGAVVKEMMAQGVRENGKGSL